MKMYLKILAALVSIGVVWLGYDYYLYVQDHPIHCSDTYTLEGGEMSSKHFVEARDCLVRYKAAKKTFVVKNLEGGKGFAALALGILIHRHHWDVEVIGLCASSCANWIFPAGKTKYLTSQSLPVFHGGPRQKNLWEFAEQLDHGLAANGAPVSSVQPGREGREGYVSWDPERSPADEEVLEFLAIDKNASAVEKLRQFMNASDKFYQELGINPQLPEHGQLGVYEPSYKSDKYKGFLYRLDSLRKLGIRNIELKDGEWHPERNPEYPNVYEVTFP